VKYSEHYRQYLHAFAASVLNIHVSSAPDSDQSYAATALGVIAGRKNGEFSSLEGFCEEMEDIFRISPKTNTAT
jgi:sugar (pentulose or hexulose) kinase